MEPSVPSILRPASSRSPQNGSSSPASRRRGPAFSNGHADHHAEANIPELPARQSELSAALDTYDSQYLPGHPKSLSAIAALAFLLGGVLALSLALTLYALLTQTTPLWRVPLFFSILCVFHFLEFWTTARYNTRAAQVSSFLLSQNGSAYNIAHSAALLECLLTNLLFPHRAWLPPAPRAALLCAGALLVVAGQAIRSAAMIAAGTNFNHVVQRTKDASHRLVTDGVYAYLRHPSYFGFFWWGLGTQLLLGNPLCFAAYTVVLWRFFAERIEREEKLLVAFFGNEYVVYRKSTHVGIPFIR